MKRFQVITFLALALVASIAYAVDPVTTAAALPGLCDPTTLGMTALALGATNFVQEGDTITLAAPYDVLAGHGALVNGNIFGVALNDVVSAANGEFAMEGVWDLLAVTLDTFAQGANVYWDNSAKKCTSTSSGNNLIGAALAAKLNTETSVRVRLNGISV